MVGQANINFKGSIPALITPMFANGEVDYDSFQALIDWHIQEGSDALVIAGTSGESPTVSVEEHIHLIKEAVEYAAGRIPIIAGVGANSTKEAIHLQNNAYDAGAQAGLSVCPYYNKPTQEGMYQHFKTIAEHSPLPTLLYNVPGRTVANMSNDTILRLAEIPNIIGIKEASGDIARLGDLFSRKPQDFQVISGDDPTAAALILLGGQANISVTANVAPKLMHQLCMAASQGDIATVQRLNNKLSPLNSALFCEANPIPVKFALYKIGKTAELGYRLPLCQPSEQSQQTIIKALEAVELL
ncbi:4-hydroxy-tetrahydrodipicolinate synthase [Brackiella oedipodis]|uniref:4-hydroxy-tetrahydrodipicolinate synthase n=1 Tax=Brackiella oedipodis TaxID=124225 RepID=UPI0005701034|nr:4-hydroxy-tetrahydrodipicolinate synthase [Brackiella oedipodis]